MPVPLCYISRPLAWLLRGTRTKPEQVYKELEQRVAGRRSTILRKSHPLVQAAASISGADVTTISRRHRHLLLEAEHRTRGQLAWTYRELSRNRCEFACKGRIAENLKLALSGMQLSQLIDAPPFLASVSIQIVSDDFEGWTITTVDPHWQAF